MRTQSIFSYFVAGLATSCAGAASSSPSGRSCIQYGTVAAKTQTFMQTEFCVTGASVTACIPSGAVNANYHSRSEGNPCSLPGQWSSSDSGWSGYSPCSTTTPCTHGSTCQLSLAVPNPSNPWAMDSSCMFGRACWTQNSACLLACGTEGVTCQTDFLNDLPSARMYINSGTSDGSGGCDRNNNGAVHKLGSGTLVAWSGSHKEVRNNSGSCTPRETTDKGGTSCASATICWNMTRASGSTSDPTVNFTIHLRGHALAFANAGTSTDSNCPGSTYAASASNKSEVRITLTSPGYPGVTLRYRVGIVANASGYYLACTPQPNDCAVFDADASLSLIDGGLYQGDYYEPVGASLTCRTPSDSSCDCPDLIEQSVDTSSAAAQDWGVVTTSATDEGPCGQSVKFSVNLPFPPNSNTSTWQMGIQTAAGAELLSDFASACSTNCCGSIACPYELSPNGAVDSLDLRALWTAVGKSHDDPCFIGVLDTSNDGEITAEEIREFYCQSMADFNNDGFVDGFDYDEFILSFEDEELRTCASDITADGFVDGFDYDEFVALFELSGCNARGSNAGSCGI